MIHRSPASSPIACAKRGAASKGVGRLIRCARMSPGPLSGMFSTSVTTGRYLDDGNGIKHVVSGADGIFEPSRKFIVRREAGVFT